MMIIRGDEARQCGGLCRVSKGIAEIAWKEYNVLEK